MVKYREEMAMLLKTEYLLFKNSKSSAQFLLKTDKTSVEITPILNTKAINELSEVSKPR